MDDASAERASPFACDMNTIEPDRRGEHMATIDELFRAVGDIRELPNGYAFKLPNELDVLLRGRNSSRSKGCAVRSSVLLLRLSRKMVWFGLA